MDQRAACPCCQVTGFSDREVSTAGAVVWSPLLFGLALFFAGGLLVGLFAQWMVRGCHGAWRTFLLVAIAIATPFVIVFSLVGGLLGPHFVVLYALVPYLLLAAEEGRLESTVAKRMAGCAPGGEAYGRLWATIQGKGLQVQVVAIAGNHATFE